MENRLLRENGIKNGIVIILLYFLYSPTKQFLNSLTTDAIGYQTIIVLASLLIMAFLFATYTFTFKDSSLDSPFRRLLDYINTGIIMFGCGSLLEISYITINIQLKTTFYLIGMLMLLFYISLVLFDFWDLMRAFKQHEQRESKQF